ncbi:DUF4974 domain-containing protein [Porifericola rhodea]|uniref:FecR family protein n=1 Tax=Porifericola rhodea TaxID=930972 RepID=UPI0026671188|nr:FecR domain-containing protein [Porifericola rhodea]WKN30654.1 DUF4974 domain-containing protein [Porifericola rhodea]
MARKDIYIEDLLTDDNFVKWVKHPNQERKQYWETWLQVHPDRRNDVMLAREMLLKADFVHQPSTEEAKVEVLERLMETEPQRQNNNQYAKKSRTAWLTYTTMAAALALLLLFGIFFFKPKQDTKSVAVQHPDQSWITKENPSGIKSQLQLPDGTMVWLNAESSLSFPLTFDSTQRIVKLSGEAFFDVARDQNRPFTVQSGQLSTTALGTSFNIFCYPEEESVEVSLLTGIVEVNRRDSLVQKHLLKPGEQIIYTQREFSKSQFSYNAAIGWKEGLLVFEEENLMHIKRKLERWYGIEVELIGKPDQTWRINGTFKNQSLERVLQRLRYTKDFDYQISGKKVTIHFS